MFTWRNLIKILEDLQILWIEKYMNIGKFIQWRSYNW
jgi:hypothetical protein